MHFTFVSLFYTSLKYEILFHEEMTQLSGKLGSVFMSSHRINICMQQYSILWTTKIFNFTTQINACQTTTTTKCNFFCDKIDGLILIYESN